MSTNPLNAPEMGAAAGGTEPPHTQTKALRGLLDGLVALVPTGSQGTARGIAKEIQALITALEKKKKHTAGDPEALTVANLQRTVTEAVRAAVGPAQGTPQGRSWAAVAGGGHTPAQPSQPTKIIPQRINREILVRGAEMPADLAKRTPAEIIQAINQASTKKGAIAARKLPSGDTIVTFNDSNTKEWHNRNGQWIQQAFGEQAKEARRTFAVLVKGLKKSDLQGISEEAFGAGLGLKTVDKVKFRLPNSPGLTWATALITTESQEEARRACEQGIVWNAQILDCEPYWAPLEPKQCFKCWKWGHIQRYCRKESLCGRCGTGVHGEGGRAGEALCPTQGAKCPAGAPAAEGPTLPGPESARGRSGRGRRLRRPTNTGRGRSDRGQQSQQRLQDRLLPSSEPRHKRKKEASRGLEQRGPGYNGAGRH